MSDIVDNLWRALISSCSCQTKTPEVKWHNTDCRYRVLSEAAAEITRLRADLAAAQERERVLREALEEIDAVAVDHGHYETAARTMHEIALSAMRGEP